MTQGLERVAPPCRSFAIAVEDVLARRRAGTAGPGPGRLPRAWTHEELCDVAYSSYRALLRGGIRRTPRREVVLDVAAYLECTRSECDRLLVAAGYAPLSPPPAGRDLQQALAEAGEVIDYLPLPAYAVTQDWTVHLANSLLLRLFEVQAGELAGIPLKHRNVLRFVFDPCLPVHGRLAADPDEWERLATGVIALFKQDNLTAQHEDWYRSLVSDLLDVPGFAERWHRVQVDVATTALDPLATTLLVTRPDGRSVRMRPADIRLHRAGYPGIVCLLPADRDSIRTLGELGIPTPRTGWTAGTA